MNNNNKKKTKTKKDKKKDKKKENNNKKKNNKKKKKNNNNNKKKKKTNYKKKKIEEAEKYQQKLSEDHKRIGQGILRGELQYGDAVRGSHKLHHKRGVVWCKRCGAYCTENARNLELQCEEPTRGGIGVLNRIKDNKTPRSRMSWPFDEGVGPPEGPVR